MEANKLNKLIKNRRSIFPATYIDKAIPKAIIEQVLENANYAPTHRLTQPWRFRVFTGDSLKGLGEFLATWYKENATEYSERKYQKTLKKPLKSGCVLAICMQRDPEESVPEWEEIAAVAAAVQNIQLTCAAYDIGCYWSSPKSIHSIDQLFELAEGERCLGFLFMGYHNTPQLPPKRDSIQDKVQWL